LHAVHSSRPDELPGPADQRHRAVRRRRPTDAIARIYAEFLSRDLGQTLVVENAAGAGGTIGSTRAARATPDGYTIQIGQAGTHVSSVGSEIRKRSRQRIS
jgi:hypothetical protein